MRSQEPKTFWDIEEEKTWRIYLLFSFLILLYFVPIYLIWLIIKFIVVVRLSLSSIEVPYTIFGTDTIIVLILSAVVSYIHWHRSNRRVVIRILHLLGAKYPDKNDEYHNIFQNVVGEVATAAGGIQVEPYIIPTGAMNAFALADMEGRNVIGITEGLLSRLKRDELQSVVAHEMAHIVSKDCLQTTTVCALFGIYSEAITQSNRLLTRVDSPPGPPFEYGMRRRFNIGLLSVPVIGILFISSILAQLLSMFISREREYRADANAVRFTRNPLSLASALYRIGTGWRGAGYGGENIAPIFILNPIYSRLDEVENFWADIFSTHPPLLKRLNIILNMAHADLSAVRSYLKKRKRLRTAEEIQIPEPRFYIKHNDEWLGPFTINQLKTLDFLNPDSILRPADQTRMVKAGEIYDLAIFFKEREGPLWKMKRLCPDCREWLIIKEYEGLHLWQCAYCDGLLVEIDKLPRIFVRKEKGYTKRVQRIAKLLSEETRKKNPHFTLLLDMSQPRRCPKCGDKMFHKLYSYSYHIEVDVCPKCQLIWFDKDELEILQCLIETAEDNA
ncbi:MAG TPA: hypothetical protein EYP58_03535 [bacterium (Candidatus Stahlbacteria)]|nr:hypothetical protein [Candidatus Stahlbacteria bacterium]